MHKKGQGMPLNVVVIAVIVLIVLLVLWVIFAGRSQTFVAELSNCRGSCDLTAAGCRDVGAIDADGTCGGAQRKIPESGVEKSLTGGERVCCIVLSSG